MSDRYAHGYADDDEDELPAGRGTVLTMGGPHDIRRGGVAAEPERVAEAPSAPSSYPETAPPTVAAGLFALAGAVDRLAAAIEQRTPRR